MRQLAVENHVELQQDKWAETQTALVARIFFGLAKMKPNPRQTCSAGAPPCGGAGSGRSLFLSFFGMLTGWTAVAPRDDGGEWPTVQKSPGAGARWSCGVSGGFSAKAIHSCTVIFRFSSTYKVRPMICTTASSISTASLHLLPLIRHHTSWCWTRTIFGNNDTHATMRFFSSQVQVINQ